MKLNEERSIQILKKEGKMYPTLKRGFLINF